MSVRKLAAAVPASGAFPVPLWALIPQVQRPLLPKPNYAVSFRRERLSPGTPESGCSPVLCAYVLYTGCPPFAPPTQDTGVASVSILYREVKKIAQGCVADEWRGWDLTLRCWAPEDTLSAPSPPSWLPVVMGPVT